MVSKDKKAVAQCKFNSGHGGVPEAYSAQLFVPIGRKYTRKTATNHALNFKGHFEKQFK